MIAKIWLAPIHRKYTSLSGCVFVQSHSRQPLRAGVCLGWPPHSALCHYLCALEWELMLGTLSSPTHKKKRWQYFESYSQVLGKTQNPFLSTAWSALVFKTFKNRFDFLLACGNDGGASHGAAENLLYWGHKTPPQRARWEIFGGFMHLLLLLPPSSVTHHIRHGHICVWTCV